MIISLIAAMAENRVIGSHNTIPWDLPADRKRFRELTMGHAVIMGRKTFESLPAPLAGRKTIIITRQKDYQANGSYIAHDLPSALELAAGTEEVFICGGGDIYRQSLPLARRVYLTIIHRNYAGDTFFPELPADFVMASKETIENDPAFSFVLFTR